MLEQLEIDHLEQGSRPPGHQEVVATVNLDPGLYEVELSTDEVGEDHAAKDRPRDARPRRERLPLIWGRIPGDRPAPIRLARNPKVEGHVTRPTTDGARSIPNLGRRSTRDCVGKLDCC